MGEGVLPSHSSSQLWSHSDASCTMSIRCVHGSAGMVAARSRREGLARGVRSRPSGLGVQVRVMTADVDAAAVCVMQRVSWNVGTRS